MFALDAVQTLAFAGLGLFAGVGLVRALPVLARYNIPAPVVGGLAIAVVILLARRAGISLITFDTSLQNPLMIAFFTTLGFNASVALLRVSGRGVALFLAAAAVCAVLQSVLGILVAVAFGLHPLFGVLASTATLAGGPATGLAFAPLFEQAGVVGAHAIAIAAAMAGIICGGLVGGPVATWLIRRHRLKVAPVATPATPTDDSEPGPEVTAASESPSADDSVYVALKGLVILLVAMWAGAGVSAAFAHAHITLPAYVGAMLVGAVIRNLDDCTGWLRLPLDRIESGGNVCLTFFLTMALMNLKLWELSGFASALLVNLVVQVVLVALFGLWPLFRLMGRDFDAAVMGGGFIGFMLGTTANAMAVMRTLVERYGPAPRAFLVAPLVGAFFIDFTNAMVITTFMNIFS